MDIWTNLILKSVKNQNWLTLQAQNFNFGQNHIFWNCQTFKFWPNLTLKRATSLDSDEFWSFKCKTCVKYFPFCWFFELWILAKKLSFWPVHLQRSKTRILNVFGHMLAHEKYWLVILSYRENVLFFQCWSKVTLLLVS